MKIHKRAFYMGRFQPFHNGHLDAIDQMIADGMTDITLGIGSMQESRTKNNPFTIEERIEMISASLNDRDANFTFFPVPDFNNDDAWINYIKKNVPVTFKYAYSNNPNTLNCMKKIYGVEIKTLEERVDINATKIRYEIQTGEASWKNYVPQKVAKYLENINAQNILKEIFSENEWITADAIINYNGGIVFIERVHPPYGFALPGGRKEKYESIEEAVIREAKEETNLDLVNLELLGVYSKPGRDPRGPVTSIVYIARGVGELKADDDAKSVCVIRPDEIERFDLAFDHGDIIKDYFAKSNSIQKILIQNR